MGWGLILQLGLFLKSQVSVSQLNRKYYLADFRRTPFNLLLIHERQRKGSWRVCVWLFSRFRQRGKICVWFCHRWYSQPQTLWEVVRKSEFVCLI